MSTKFDAFRQGVEPGGMMTTARVKLLICYVMKSLDMAVPKKVMTDALCETSLANYFEVANAVDELASLGYIEKIHTESGDKFKIAEGGADIASTLETDLPRSVRLKALKHAMYCADLDKKLSENEINIDKTDGGYIVTFHVGKAKDRILSVSVFAADYDQVEAMKNGFISDPEKLYKNVLTSLLGEF